MAFVKCRLMPAPPRSHAGTASQLIPGVRPTPEMRSAARPLAKGLGLVVVLMGTLACGRSAIPVEDPAGTQAAAVAFLAKANGDRVLCVHVATGPNELWQGRVAVNLRDPPSTLVTQLQAQGVMVRAFSTCSMAERDKLTYAIGWPHETPTGFELHADRICGARCGEGSVVRVKEVGTVWRATEAATTWIK